ncbi:MAG: 4Fe-4S binding protein [Thermoplasmata archaeon]
MKIRTYRITLQFLIFVTLNLGLLIGFYGIPFPFFYCHACPAATGLCPIGAEQYAVIVDPFLLLYILSFLFLIAVLFGRATCGWGCPVGTLQDLFALKSRHRDLKDRFARFGKFIVLVLTIVLSFVFSTKVFTDICPIGFLTGTIPTLLLIPGYVEPMSPYFYIKFALTVIFFVMIYFVARSWCRYICPLGAQFSIFNKISVVKIAKTVKCVECKACALSCPMGLAPWKDTDSIECIRCGRCVEACKRDGLNFSIRGRENVH